MERYIIKFSEAGINDVAEVGSKNVSLGEMYNKLTPKGLLIPDGFAITAAAFRLFLQYNTLNEPLRQLMERLDHTEFSNLNAIGIAARKLIMDAKFPRGPEQEITEAYAALLPAKNNDVAVRSSVFSMGFMHLFPEGLHESYLNIRGPLALIYAIKCCYASLYSNRAIKFRETYGITHDSVVLSITIQRMVRADTGCSGIGYTSHSFPGFSDVVRLTGNWGLGQNTPMETWDEYIIPKPFQKTEHSSIKTIGSKSRMTVYKDVSAGTNSTLTLITAPELREKPVLDDAGVFELAGQAVLLETYFGHPVEFKWARDGENSRFYILGVRAGE